jgi:uncharacterized membrane protein
MSTQSVSQLFLLYTWFALTALIFFFLLIARFYQKFSSERTYFRAYIAPIVLFGIAAVRYASIDQVRDPLADTIAGIGGICLIVLVSLLVRRMTHKRQAPLED